MACALSAKSASRLKRRRLLNMPVSWRLGDHLVPIDYKLYPKDWKYISADVVKRAGNRCEGSPAYPDCRAENGKPHPITESRVVLTVAHLDHDIGNNKWDNLKAWCQRCHLTYDSKHHAQTRWAKRYVNQKLLFNEV